MSIQGMTRLSAQSLGPDHRVVAAVRQGKPAVFKVVDPDPGWVHELHDASPDTTLIGRIVDDSLSGKLTATEGRNFADRVLAKADELGGIIRWWEGSNEAAVGPAPIRRLCDFEKAFAERVQAQGYHALVGGFSTGTPEIVGPDAYCPWMGEWELLYPAMQVAHGVHFREYWHPYQLDDTWNAYRYEKWWSGLPDWARRKWWLVGELGIDGMLTGAGRKGWSEYVSPTAYLELLDGYAGTMSKYPNVAAAIYIAGLGNDSSWASYNVVGGVLDALSERWAAAPKQGWGTTTEYGGEPVGEPVSPQPLVAPNARNLIDQLPVREGTQGYMQTRTLEEIVLFMVHWLGARGRNFKPETIWREQTTHQEPDRPKFPAGAYHFQITQDGTVTQLHRLTTVTWQSAGNEQSTGRPLNDVSVGVAMEPERLGDGYRWTEQQISSCLALYDWLRLRLKPELLPVGHYEVRPLTPEGLPSTECPGPAWPTQLKPLLVDRDPEQPPVPDLEEATRIAWQSLIISHNPEFAFPRKAIQVLGQEAFALSKEARFEIGDAAWVRQLWSDGEQIKVLMTKEGEWDSDDIKVVEYT